MKKYYPALAGWSIGVTASVFCIRHLNPGFWLLELGALGLALLITKVCAPNDGG